MIYSDPLFIFIFLPIVVALSIFLKRQKNKTNNILNVILISSIVFYLSHGLFDLIVNFGILLASYIFLKSSLKLRYILCLILIAVLMYLKYENTNLDSYLYLPIGISFLIFQFLLILFFDKTGITYLISDFRKISVFLLFFCQGVAGPIINLQIFKNFLRRVSNLSIFRVKKRIIIILPVFLIAISKKLLLADPLFDLYFLMYEEDISSFIYFYLISLIFLMALYFDFSAYSEMAWSIALILGMKLPINFASPLRAINYVELWKRWHITLTQSFGRLITIPSQTYAMRNFSNKTNIMRNFSMFFPVFLGFLVSGIWHGWGISFVLWGFLNFLFWWLFSLVFMKRLSNKLPYVSWFLTLSLFSITLQLFVFSPSEIFSILSKINYSSFNLLFLEQLSNKNQMILFFSLLILLFGIPSHTYVSSKEFQISKNIAFKNITNYLQRVIFIFPYSFRMLLLLFLAWYGYYTSTGQEFFYFRF